MTAKSRRIMVPNTYTEDPRWVDAGADAFALHIAACCYSDRINSDGKIDARMITRICLAVPPENAQAAATALIDAGFWLLEDSVYEIVDYLEDGIGFAAAEQETLRGFWAIYKKRKRHHDKGVHDLCTKDKCPWVRQNVSWEAWVEKHGEGPVKTVSDNVLDSPGQSEDSTRPYPTKGKGRGRGAGQSRPASGANAPTAGEPPRVRMHVDSNGDTVFESED